MSLRAVEGSFVGMSVNLLKLFSVQDVLHILVRLHRDSEPLFICVPFGHHSGATLQVYASGGGSASKIRSLYSIRG